MSALGGAVVGSPDKRLSEQEQKLVITLLSDPTYFPIEFKSWLKLFIENSDIRINQSQVWGGGGTGAGQPVGLPAGIVLGCPGNKYPADCIPCDGRVLNRVEFFRLFDAISTVWGAGDGTTNFNIPDFRDRSLYGAGSRVGLGLTDGRALGSRGGPNHYHTIALATDGNGNHSHSVSGSCSVSVSGGISGSTNETGNHDHTYQRPGSSSFVAGGSSGGTFGGAAQTGATGAHTHSVSGSFSGSGSGSISGGTNEPGSHNHNVSGSTSGGYGPDMPSFAGINWVITTGKD